MPDDDLLAADSRTLAATRRRFLTAGGAAVALAFASRLPSSFTSSTERATASYPFTLGVASGDPLPDGVVIWTRLAPRPLERSRQRCGACQARAGCGPALRRS